MNTHEDPIAIRETNADVIRETDGLTLTTESIPSENTLAIIAKGLEYKKIKKDDSKAPEAINSQFLFWIREGCLTTRAPSKAILNIKKLIPAD
jgi:hypothetical protein